MVDFAHSHYNKVAENMAHRCGGCSKYRL